MSLVSFARLIGGPYLAPIGTSFNGSFHSSTTIFDPRESNVSRPSIKQPAAQKKNKNEVPIVASSAL